MLTFLFTLALAANLVVGTTQVHAGRIHVSPACQVNQDPQGGCVG